MDVSFFTKHPRLSQFLILLVAFFALVFLVNPNETNILWRLPSLLAPLPGAATMFISEIGQWPPAMETLSFVLVAAPVSILLGLLFGVLSYKSRAVEAMLAPLLNIAQTMPYFSNLCRSWCSLASATTRARLRPSSLPRRR